MGKGDTERKGGESDIYSMEGHLCLSKNSTSCTEVFSPHTDRAKYLHQESFEQSRKGGEVRMLHSFKVTAHQAQPKKSRYHYSDLKNCPPSELRHPINDFTVVDSFTTVGYFSYLPMFRRRAVNY